MAIIGVCGLQATLRHTACIVPYSAIIEAIYACTNALIANNPFAFDTFGLQFYEGNNKAYQ